MKYVRPRKMPDGSLAYPKRGWEPPPSIPGYKRKSSNPHSADAWIFLPVWQPCVYRDEIEVSRRACGCISYSYICIHPDDVCNGCTVSADICNECKLNAT
jgi:hypothetical protein